MSHNIQVLGTGHLWGPFFCQADCDGSWRRLVKPWPAQACTVSFTLFLALFPFPSSALLPGLAHPNGSPTWSFCSWKDRVQGASVHSHGALYIPLWQHVTLCMTTFPFTHLDKEPHAKSCCVFSCVFLMCILSLGMESVGAPWILE